MEMTIHRTTSAKPDFCAALRKMKLLCPLLCLCTVLFGGGVFAADGVIKIKLGTLAPNGTSYHKSLMAMGEKWRKASGGAVQLTVFAGGTQGSESDMVGLMQTGNMDAGLLTTGGLSEIDPAALAMQVMPMFLRTLDEVDYVSEKLRPQLNARLLAKGYVVLFWSDSGWVRFFSTQPVVHPDDLRKLKVFSGADSAAAYDLWKAAGFSPVSLESTGIPQGLLSGTISAVPTVPIFALAAQFDSQAKYMLELNWGPLVGAAVVRKKTWDRVPAGIRDQLMEIAAETGKQVKAAGRAESDAAVAAMVRRGLTVHKVTPEVQAEWTAVIDKVQDRIRGKVVPADVFDEAQRIVKEYRSKAPQKSQ
jgi:TRAP-type C4-dicarboxylate transport system substrate-binding protein